MQRREAKFTTKFRKWLYYKWDNNIPAYFEIKVSKMNCNSIPFNAVSDKQHSNLQVRKFVHKFSDFDRMGTPFDMICFCGKGFVVLHYAKRGNNQFFIIPIENWLKEKETSDRKSITYERACEIATFSDCL